VDPPAGRPLDTVDVERNLAMLDALFAEAPVGLGLFDTKLRYVRVNDVLRTIIGLPEGELVGRTVAEAVPGLGDAVITHMRQAFDTGEPVRDLEMWGRTPASEARRCLSLSYFRLHARDGAPLGLASVVVDVTAPRLAQRAAVAATERLALLSRAGQLLGSSLDTRQTLAALADLTVPAFADHCIVDLVEPAERDADAAARPPVFRRVALVHAADVPPGGDAWRGTDVSLTYPEVHPVVQVVRSAAGLLASEIAPEQIDVSAPTQESAAFGHAAGLRSAIVVPLTAHGTVLGALSFVTSVSNRRYEGADLEVATEIAGRAAVALDNAQRYERERSVALTLQHSLLPQELTDTIGVTTESVYLPGATEATVGGDWFDVIPLPSGRTGVVIGDVMGRGVHAAAVMGQLRAALRSCAVLDLTPAVLLHHLDDLVQVLDAVQIVTCVYGVYDPATATMTLANAGHVPPLLLDDGDCRLVAASTGPPLGTGRPDYLEHSVTMLAGSALVLYTDGLVERRGSDIDVGIQRLCEALGTAPPGAGLCERALDMLGGDGEHDDDIAMLVVRPVPCDERATGVEAVLEPSPSAPREARRSTAATLAGWGVDDRVEAATLLVSELVTNAVRHARSEIRLRLRLIGQRLVVEVADRDSRMPRTERLLVDAESGRGLRLVSSMALRWGVRPTPTGKVIWLEL
jgi:PAS domain S-box-containing protein